MTAGQASRRLIDAAATLDIADRALLNLWLHRGLADERLAQLTGLTVEAVRGRRGRIIAGLSAELGLPEHDVADALRALEPVVPPDPAPADHEPRSAGHEDLAGTSIAEPATVTTTAVDALPAVEAVPPDLPAPALRSRRSRAGIWLAVTVTVAIAVAAILIILLSGGLRWNAASVTPASSSTPAAVATVPISGGVTTSAPDPASTKSTTKAARSGPRAQALVALPGGLAHASGLVTLLGRGQNLRLRLRLKGLPRLRRGHYEAWLYDTVLDSQALGRVHARGTETYRLPHDAHHFSAIDISYQPRGSVTESGESRLRAVNPAHYVRAATVKRTKAARHPRATHHRRRHQTAARHHRTRARPAKHHAAGSSGRHASKRTAHHKT